MADSGDEGGSRLNLTALGVGAAGLTTVIAGLSTTGTIGRVIRNDPEVLAAALMLVLLGAAALAAAGLPLTSGYAEAVFSIVGLELTVAGLILGALAGALTAEHHPEEPSVTAKLSQADRHLTGTVKAGTLTAKSRVVVIVDGLRVVGDKGSRYRANTLMQTYAGPDAEGNVNVPIELTVPAGRFDAIGINSWTEPDPLREDDDEAATTTPTSTATSTTTPTSTATSTSTSTPTSTSDTTQTDDGERRENERSCKYDRRVSTDPTARARTRIGCLILPLSPVPRRPRVTISWLGAGDEAARVEVSVLARNAPVPLYAGERACEVKDVDLEPDDETDMPCSRREERGAGVALVVRGGPPESEELLYRAILEPNGNGYLKQSVQLAVPTDIRRVCAVTAYVYEGGTYPRFECPEPVISTERAIAEIRRPAPNPEKKDP